MRIEIDESIQCRFKTIEFAAEKRELDKRRGEVAGMTKSVVAKWPVKQLSWWVYLYAVFHNLKGESNLSLTEQLCMRPAFK